MTQGRLVLVVGPSGAGKDTLIAGAREALAGTPGFSFPAREITRPIDAGGENHIAVTTKEVHARARAGEYALSWQAHDTWYGVSRVIDARLAAGETVIVNASRTAIDTTRRRYPNTLIVHVTAPKKVLAARLSARGRETDAEVGDRVTRSDAFDVFGPDVVTIVNDGTPRDAVAALLAVLVDPEGEAAERAWRTLACINI